MVNKKKNGFIFLPVIFFEKAAQYSYITAEQQIMIELRVYINFRKFRFHQYNVFPLSFIFSIHLDFNE